MPKPLKVILKTLETLFEGLGFAELLFDGLWLAGQVLIMIVSLFLP